MNEISVENRQRIKAACPMACSAHEERRPEDKPVVDQIRFWCRHNCRYLNRPHVPFLCAFMLRLWLKPAPGQSREVA